MKKSIKLCLIIPFLSLAIGNAANAKNYEFINGDTSDKTALCISSTVSQAEWKGKSSAMGLSDADVSAFSCNGLAIEQFGQGFRDNSQSDADPVKVFAFTADTKKVAVSLCIAASTSNKKLFYAMKEAGVTKNNLYLVRCNGMSIKRFAKKFGNKKYRF